MSLTLALQTQLEVPLEANVICPDRLAGLSIADVERLTVYYGNRQQPLADFFKVSGDTDGDIHLEGDLSRVKHLGAGMKGGTLHIHGAAGAHLGAEMSGGNIIVDGDAGDWVAPEISGGRVHVKGNAGHMAGSAYRGSPIGMTGGEILIEGSARNEIGHGMRNGLIAVGGHGGDFVAVNMLAGSIFIFGSIGIRTGAGMKRGSVICMQDAELLPTFAYACSFHPQYLRPYLLYLGRCGMPVQDAHIGGTYARWQGDAVEMSRGEVLIFRG